MMEAESRLLFMFRLGTHGLNEELDRRTCRGGREGNKECELCSSGRADFLIELQEKLDLIL